MDSKKRGVFMNLKNVFAISIVLTLFVCAGLCMAQTIPDTAAKTTLDNLMTAYNGENNAHVKYLAFAAKADEEGYGKVASLFRAASRAEQVHFEWHAKVIKSLGGTPTATIETPVVKSTAENIQSSIDGETYESTIMYPEFLAKAKLDKISGAVDAFEDAQAAETVHANLYKAALKNLASMKGDKKDFYVCPKCGNVVDMIPGPSCPICMEDTKLFILIS